MATVRPPAPSPPPSSGEDADGYDLRRLGGRAGAAAVAAMLATVPPALRIDRYEPSASLPWVWAVLAGTALLPMAFLVALLTGARRGARTFAGEDGAALALAVASWVGLVFPAWLGLGSVLRATTHHHALAGVTFAIGALAVALALAWVAARFGPVLARFGPARPFVLLVVVEVLVLTALALRGVARASGQDATAALVVDGLALLLAALLAVRFATVTQRLLALVGPPLAICLVLLAITGFRTSPSLKGAVTRYAPLYGALFPSPPQPLTPQDPVLSSPDGANSGAMP